MELQHHEWEHGVMLGDTKSEDEAGLGDEGQKGAMSGVMVEDTELALGNAEAEWMEISRRRGITFVAHTSGHLSSNRLREIAVCKKESRQVTLGV